MLTLLAQIADAAADLVLGSCCLGCERPGRPLCPYCRAALPTGADLRWPTPPPPGLAPPYATGAYGDLLRALVLGHKEEQIHGLAGPLGRQLAHAVGAALCDLGLEHRDVVLVPVPSRRRVVRQRGYDATAAMVRVAAAELRRVGVPARMVRVARLRLRVRDQAGLSVTERHANLAGSMAARPRAAAGLRRATRPTAVVVCDDVITTGATAREAQRALTVAGLAVVAIATVAATERKGPFGAAR